MTTNATQTSTPAGQDQGEPIATRTLRIGTGEFVLDGEAVPVAGGANVHQAAIAHIGAQISAPVQVMARDRDDEYELRVSPGGATVPLMPGTITTVDEGWVTFSSSSPASEPSETENNGQADEGLGDVEAAGASTPARAGDGPSVRAPMPKAPRPATTESSTAHDTHLGVGPHLFAEPQSRAERRASITFLPGAAEAFSTAPVEQVSGWHALLQRLGVQKAPTGPTPAQMVERAELRAISQHWAGPRTIAVVNPKGGAGKTPTTVLLAAMFARWGGSGCLAWDNNQTRGTMGWRTEQGPHQAHVRDLLAATDALMRTGARAADLAAFVHHQTEDKFDVLRSNPHSIAPQERLTAADLDALHQVAARYYRLVFIDSGNDESAPNWLQMIEHTDQLVVATTTRPDHAEAARLVLEELHARGGSASLLANEAVVVVAHADQNEEPAAQYLSLFEQMARAAAPIPYDPGMRAAHLRLDGLRPDTQVAWRHAAALVSDGLGSR